MILVILGIVAIFIGIGGGMYASKKRFDHIVDSVSVDASQNQLNHCELDLQLDRIDKLRNNLYEVRKNVEKLDIPTPESVSSYDETQNVLNKLARFYEKHNLSISGSEQVILSLLPSSQIGQSLHSMIQCLPVNLGNALFGDSIHTLSNSILSIPSAEGVERFVHGMTHLSHVQQISVLNHLEHHNWTSIALTPIKSGIIEASGIHDATHDLVNSLHQIGGDIASSLEGCTSLGDLTSVSDLDITGHIPVITIALSSYREFQLLENDKTDYVSSLKNIALDAAGAGIGGMGGAKAGAIAGSFFGPIGTIAGGILGGIGGAVAGRYATNKIKMRPLKIAIEAYTSQYNVMQQDTNRKSKNTLSAIKNYAADKRSEFKCSELLIEIPVVGDEVMLHASALSILNCILNELACMKNGIIKIKESFWFSNSKHGHIIAKIEESIQLIEEQLPPIDSIKNNPKSAIEILLRLNMPNRKVSENLQSNINKCTEDLKQQNDTNDASVMIWAYMVNNLYQKTLNDVADFSNKQMDALNKTFKDWRIKMQSLENDVEKEKGKLGL